MIEYPWGTLVTGVLLMIAGVLTLARHFFLEPVSSKYPKAPAFVRHSMFMFAAVLLFIGLRYVWAFLSDGTTNVPPHPPASMQFLATALVLYKAAMLLNIVRQRYPDEVWTRLNRINDALNCPDNKIATWFGKG